jgi:hypothetical protein
LVTGRSKALVSQFGLGNADTINVARRKPGSTGEPDVERVKIRTLAAQIFGLQHEANVADSAAARLGISKGVVNDPLVVCINRDDALKPVVESSVKHERMICVSKR